MINPRLLGVVVLGLVLSTPHLYGAGRAQYRDFQLGSDLASVSARSGVAASEARTLHLRPAVTQELEWRIPLFASGSPTPQNDAVQQIVFSFYNDQLFRLVVGYDRQRTDGMTDGDMIDALSVAYGSPLPSSGAKKAAAVASQIDIESGTPIARWGDADYSVVLYRSSYATFRVIVASPRLEALARTADAQAVRLDEREAPQRELARQKKEVEDIRASQEKARLANKAAFRP
jgi:hypothetical protein